MIRAKINWKTTLSVAAEIAFQVNFVATFAKLAKEGSIKVNNSKLIRFIMEAGFFYQF